jgi:hypothetical protein
MCECLAKHIYDKCGGKIYEKSTAVSATSWGAANAVATATSAGRLYITHITVLFATAARTMNIGVDADGDRFKGVTVTGVILIPVELNLSSAPLILEAGESLKAWIDPAGTDYVVVRGYYK